MSLANIDSRQSVLEAVKEFDALGRERFLSKYGFHPAHSYYLFVGGKRYDSKAIVGVAQKYARPDIGPMAASEFSGGEITVARKLRSLGFEVVSEASDSPLGRAGSEEEVHNTVKNQTTLDFEVGKLYNRATDIHGRFGGQRQGGISTPKSAPVIFLFTGEGGENFGYKDGWDDNGIFRLFGEGQTGDMSFVRGNAAIRNLFHALGKGEGVRFLGVFVCAGYNVEKGIDGKGVERDAIVFHLAPIGKAPEIGKADTLADEDIAALRKRAYESSKTGLELSTKKSSVSIMQRSAVVRAYVLRRANGVCECCKKEAPFKREDGRPYLEPHHTHRLADGGPDNPAWVGGICPNCHKEIHFGERGELLNVNLREYLEKVEAAVNP
jgi:5-methylcytosine-specific restriction protein A